MTTRISNDERRRRLAARHFLAPDANPATLVELTNGLNGLHSSDPATPFLSAWARTPSLEIVGLEAALYEDRTLIRVLGMRGTLFVVPVDVAPLLQHGCAGPLAPRERKRLIGMLEDSGVATDGEAWLDRVSDATVDALEARGQATASQLKEDVPELAATITYRPDKKWGGSFGVSTRVLFLLATDGRIVRGRPRGSWVSSQYRWAPVSSWVPPAVVEVGMEAARALLAERWLRSFGPAPVSDLEWWSGWGKRATSKALATIDVADVELEDGPGISLANDLDTTPDPSPWVALLPSLDSTVMGWKQRDWFLGGHGDALFDRNGNAGPTIWWNGRVVGGWTQRPNGEVAYRLLEKAGRDAENAIAAKASELTAWLGERRFITRFRTPLDKDLYDA